MPRDEFDDDDPVVLKTDQDFANLFVKSLMEAVASSEKQAADTQKTVNGNFGMQAQDDGPGFKKGDWVIRVEWTCEPGQPVTFTKQTGVMLPPNLSFVR